MIKRLWRHQNQHYHNLKAGKGEGMQTHMMDIMDAGQLLALKKLSNVSYANWALGFMSDSIREYFETPDKRTRLNRLEAEIYIGLLQNYISASENDKELKSLYCRIMIGFGFAAISSVIFTPSELEKFIFLQAFNLENYPRNTNARQFRQAKIAIRVITRALKEIYLLVPATVPGTYYLNMNPIYPLRSNQGQELIITADRIRALSAYTDSLYEDSLCDVPAELLGKIAVGPKILATQHMFEKHYAKMGEPRNIFTTYFADHLEPEDVVEEVSALITSLVYYSKKLGESVYKKHLRFRIMLDFKEETVRLILVVKIDTEELGLSDGADVSGLMNGQYYSNGEWKYTNCTKVVISLPRANYTNCAVEQKLISTFPIKPKEFEELMARNLPTMSL